MNAIENAIKFLEEIVIECEPNTGCGRCDDARKIVEGLKVLSNQNNKPLVIANVSNSLPKSSVFHSDCIDCEMFKEHKKVSKSPF